MCMMNEADDDEQRKAFDTRVREIRHLLPDEAFTAAGEPVQTQAAFRAQVADIRAEQALRFGPLTR